MTADCARVIAIGASAGGVQALLRILPALPADFPCPILIVVHVPPNRENALVGLFAQRCQIIIKEAEDKEAITGGVCYFAPADYHLLVEADATLALSLDEPVNYSRPSIDVLLEAAADAFEHDLTAIILTGANNDGAVGAAAVAAAGGCVIVEDPAQAEVPTMPVAALAACPSAKVMQLQDITSYLLRLGQA